MPILFFALTAFLFIYAEFSMLVWVSSRFGIFALMLLLFVSGAVGLAMIRTGGVYTLFNVRKQLAQGEMPARSLLKSAHWIAAGVLFIIPGFLTDILALLLLTPVCSLWIERFIGRKVRFISAQFSFRTDRTSGQYQTDDNNVFEAEFERRADEDKKLK